VLLGDVCKTACLAFLLAVGVTLLPNLLAKRGILSRESVAIVNDAFSNLTDAANNRILTPLRNAFSSVKSAVLEKAPGIVSKATKQSSSSQSKSTVPMPFEGDGGWGKCTFRSSEPLGDNFVQYKFTLPKSSYTIPLTLGQQLDFCCLSADDDICTGSFYLYDDDSGKSGVARVVLPKDGGEDMGGGSKFMEVLRNELRPGDEVAIKPGKSHLTYSGKHVPVTDMVYVTSGLGIVPILDQIRAITPRGSSSVKTASVVWMNTDRADFDLAMDDLEKEYLKYPSKLAVSCIMMEKYGGGKLEGNPEVEEAVPYFNAGTMAVVCGPKRFAEKAKGYLMRKGYPENCICVLP